MWARIDSGQVVEITGKDPTGRFHPSMHWEKFDGRSKVDVGWRFENGEFSAPPAPDITELAAQKRAEIDTARDTELAKGLPHEIAGEQDVVQTRPQDQLNLLGLRAKAEAAREEGITEPVMKFRGQKNITRYLTPDEMHNLTTAALAHIEEIYDHSWERKDAIKVALEAEDRDGIEAVEW
ncbi:DUF4376 domain-containing protein [Halomonas janggokensis]|uniref:DUF4376 domain-containing protein n=1 Tax=Vreelandella janggokensis TaxID=370767 RepID=UPI0022A6DE28|nr:DUF4376 domain-containing protein [Halomonas janggokensis]MCZ0930301.1 DUF4376 domain-containing protein [Halomonas janggokensis]